MVGTPSLTEKTAASGAGAQGEQTEVEPSPKAGAPRSGKLLVRMPASLHDELARAAAAEGVSLNQLITSALASAVGWRGSGEPEPVAPQPVAPKGAESPPPASAEPTLPARVIRIALVANLVVLAIAAIAAIALLIAAWQAGF